MLLVRCLYDEKTRLTRNNGAESELVKPVWSGCQTSLQSFASRNIGAPLLFPERTSFSIFVLALSVFSVGSFSYKTISRIQFVTVVFILLNLGAISSVLGA